MLLVCIIQIRISDPSGIRIASKGKKGALNLPLTAVLSPCPLPNKPPLEGRFFFIKPPLLFYKTAERDTDNQNIDVISIRPIRV